MANKRIDLEEKMRLISECRQSGLSDYRWCKEHHINPSTFYSWINKLRNRTCATQITQPCSGTVALSKPQDVVRVDVISESKPVIKNNPNPTFITSCMPSASIEISVEDVSIRVNNEADPMLLAQLIKALKGVPC